MTPDTPPFNNTSSVEWLSLVPWTKSIHLINSEGTQPQKKKKDKYNRRRFSLPQTTDELRNNDRTPYRNAALHPALEHAGAPRRERTFVDNLQKKLE